MAARKTVTVVFCDIVDSTPLGERIDPEVHRRIQERYFEAVRGALERHGGTVEKFIGDAAMAVFGIPVAHDDDALRAVRAASDLRPALSELNKQLNRDHGVTLAIRTGVNTGEVVAGDPSHGQAFATGDAVTTTQRLEASARAGEILIGESTYRLVSNAVLVEPVEPLTLKGKTQLVAAWRLMGVIEGAPPFPRRLDTPLVGREDELDRLRAELAAAVSERRCRLATVVGPAGIGKSRLGNELLRVAAEEAAALVGRCLPYGDGVTYWPLRGIVLGAVGHLTPGHIAERLEGAEDAARIAALVADAVGSAEASRGSEETFWAIRRFLEHLARERPLIVALDELQWAEPTLLDLVEYLVGWSTDAPILLMGLGRAELGERRPSWPITISLGPLSSSDTERLADTLAGDREVPIEERSRITAAAEGNPLFLEQLLALGEEGGQEQIPASIHAILAARLDRLDAGERAVLERASVVGREFTRGAVSELSGDESVGPTLLSLARRDLIEPHPSSVPGDDGFRFRHVLIRDAAYLGLAKEARAALHQEYADWLGSAGELDELVGYHLEQAHRYRQELGPTDTEIAIAAGERLARAGRRAMRRGDLPAAVNLMTRAAALLPDDHTERRELLPILGSALMRTGDFSRAENALNDALEAAQSAGDQRLELRTLIEREFFRAFTSPEESVEEIVAVADKAIPLLEDLGDELGLAKAWWLKSEVHVNACRWAARAENLERALEHARRAGDQSEQSTLASQIAWALYCGPTPVDEAVERCERLLAELPDDRSLQASVTGSIAGLRAMRGDFDEARRLQHVARTLYEELGQRFRVAARSLIAAEIETLSGRPAEASRILGWALGELREMGITSVMSTVAAFLADALATEDRNEEAIHYSKLSEQHSSHVDIATQVMWRVARARASGERRLAEEAVLLATPTDYSDIKARAFAAAGEFDDARRVYEQKGNVAAVAGLLVQQTASS